MSTTWALVIAAGLLVANGLFVAAEFAVVASKPHRLVPLAVTSPGARAALRSSRELSLMLAGAQLGITLCTIALGALAKPAVADVLTGPLTLVGLPHGTADAAAFAIALSLVVFLHMVVGEMAPKSWAISAPERVATLLSLPFRAFVAASRGMLAALNGLANATLRLVGVAPRDSLTTSRDLRELRVLLGHSREHGMLAGDEHDMLDRIVASHLDRVCGVMVPARHIVAVGADADVGEAERVSLATGRSRLVVHATSGNPIGMVHARDLLRATTTGRPARVRDLVSALPRLDYAAGIYEAIDLLRHQNAQLALVTNGHTVLGLVAMEDLLEHIIGRFDDETDNPPVVRGHHAPVEAHAPVG